MKKIMLLASILYFTIAPLTYHPDTKLTLYYPTLGNEKVWNIYKYLHENKDDAPPFHYPPMHFWVLKVELPIVKLIGGKGIVEWTRIGGSRAYLSEKMYLYNLATKLPILILVLLSGWLINKIVIRDGFPKRVANRACAIWLFNPITIYSAVVMGQNDMLAIFPFLLGLYWYYSRPYLAFMLFGLGGSIKSYPLIWAIILGLIYPTRVFWKKIVLTIIPLFVYFLTMVPFLKYDYFIKDVVFSGLSIRIFEGVWDIGFGDKLLLVPMLLMLLLLVSIKKRMSKSFWQIATVLMTANLLILGFTHFHPQWFIWIAPFMSMVMAVGRRKDWWWFAFILISLLGVILMFNDKFLYWGLVAPLKPDLINLPLVSELLARRGVEVGLINNLCHSAIAGVALYWLFVCFGKNRVYKK